MKQNTVMKTLCLFAIALLLIIPMQVLLIEQNQPITI